jgi:hypothetical protein
MVDIPLSREERMITTTRSTFSPHPRIINFQSSRSDYYPISASAVKAGAFEWEVDPPGNWFVALGNNRSGRGGSKAVEAFDVKGRLSGSVSM